MFVEEKTEGDNSNGFLFGVDRGVQGRRHMLMPR